jgi:DNA-binding LacI/PurR family transcriptional regulator
MTYRKIAQLAGVSPSTVSKVLSGSSGVGAETAEKIRKIAEENGVVRPKYHKNRTTTRIALIVPEIVSVYYSQNITEIVSKLREYGIEPYIHICGFSEECYCHIIDILIDDGMTNGIITLTTHKYPHKINMPIVELCGGSRSSYYDVITADVETGIIEAVEYLVSLGHKKIGFVGEKNTDSKLKYFKSAAMQLEIPIDSSHIFISNKRFEQIGQEAAEYYMKLTDRPTALLCAYDEVALGAISTLTANGISVPDDISIIGINDIPAASYASIPLTTIRTYASEIIQIGVELLMDKIKNPEKHMTQKILVRCELIIRATTAKVKNIE